MAIVWLLKADDEGNSSPYSDLEKNGFSLNFVSPLVFEYCNESALKDSLEKPQNHAGIIFGSTRSVNAVSRLYQKIPHSIHKQWKEKKIFGVGPSTAKKASQEFSFEVIGHEAGNAEQLADIIIREVKSFDKPLLLPCGNLKSSFPKLLAKADIDFRALSVYETKQNSTLKSSLTSLLSKEKPNFIVFFSPSGVEFSVPILEKLSFDFTGCKIIAIGPTTNSALVKAGLPVYGICPEPTANGILHVLKS